MPLILTTASLRACPTLSHRPTRRRIALDDRALGCTKEALGCGTGGLGYIGVILGYIATMENLN